MADENATGGDQTNTDDSGEDTGAQAGDKETQQTQDTGADKGDGEDKRTDGEVDDWRAAITDEKTRKFADKFTSGAEAAISAFKARQQLSNSVQIPGKKSTDEETKTFRKALGVPDSHEAYKVAIPEDLPEELQLDDAGKVRLDNYLKGMHEAGATPTVVQRGVDLYYGFLADELEAHQKAVAEATKIADGELAREWGKDAKRNDELGRRAYETFGNENIAKWLDEAELDGVKLGDHPHMRRLFANIGANMGEDRLHMPLSDDRKEDITSRKDEIHAWQHGTPQEQEKYKRPAIQAELAALYREEVGDQPIVGREMRTL